MTRPVPNVTIKIDKIRSDQPDLDRSALQTALEVEVRRALETHGADAFGTGGAYGQRHATLQDGNGPLNNRIAAATVKAVSS